MLPQYDVYNDVSQIWKHTIELPVSKELIGKRSFFISQLISQEIFIFLEVDTYGKQ